MIRDLDFEYTPQPWMTQGECRNSDVDPDWFFPDYGNSFVVKAALNVCRDCKVRKECMNYALDNWPVIGIWGGLQNNELKARIKERKINERSDSN